jgi:3-oxoacyl-[acyl-carrier-protein] synthase III
MPKVIGAHFLSSAFVLGKHEILNQDLSNNRAGQLPKKRTWAQENELPRDLAEQAAHKLLTQEKIDPGSIDILYSTSFADTVNIGFGPYIQKSINAKNASVLQIDTACASFLSQVEIADALIKQGVQKNILLISVSHMISRLKMAQNEWPGMMLGEGAAATMLSRGAPSFDIDNSAVSTDNLNQKIYPTRAQDHDWHANGSGFKFGFDDVSKNSLLPSDIDKLALSLERVLRRNNLKHQQVDYLLSNYPNPMLMGAILDRLSINENKLVKTYDESGDIAQASIPVQLGKLAEQVDYQNIKNIAMINFSLDAQHISAGLLKTYN